MGDVQTKYDNCCKHCYHTWISKNPPEKCPKCSEKKENINSIKEIRLA